MAYFPPTGSVVGFQSQPSSLLVGASIFGTVPVTQTTSPWVVNVPTPSYISYQLAGSVLAVSATVNTGNSSVQLLAGVAAIGSVAVLQGTNPWQVNMPSPSVLLGSSSASVIATLTGFNTGLAVGTDVTATNNLKVEQDGTQTFYEAWDSGTVETVFNWQTPVLSGTGSSTPSTGQELITSGNTANSFAVLSGKNNFQPVSPGFLLVDHQLKYNYPPATRSYGFWGVGSVLATPTASVVANNAIGFEMFTNGKMLATTWASGVRNIIQDLSSVSGTGTQPGDNATHRYELAIRGDTIFWQIDNKSVASILTGAQGPDSNLLPLLILAGTDAVGTVGASSVLTLNSQAVYMGDSTKAGNTITDKVHPQYSATVKPPSTSVASTDLPLVVALHPSTPTPAGYNMIGSVIAYGTALKVRTSIFATRTLTAGAASLASGIVDINTGFGAQVNFRINNGGAGPTVAAQVQTYVYNDSAHTLGVTFGGALVGSTSSSVATSWSIDVPIGVAAVQLTAGSNTGQDVTVDADISNVTQI